MRSLQVILGFIILLIAIHLSHITQPKPDKECVDIEFVHITHRDGFWYCHDNDTVAWVLNFQQREWKPATQFEKRRLN